MKFIDKNSLTTEIDKLINALQKNCTPNPMGSIKECLTAAEIEVLKLLLDSINTLDVEAIDFAYLQSWYQASIDETEKPIWTDEHLEELFEDFYLIPKR